MSNSSSDGMEYYHVGGSVRDKVMGKTPHDYDFAVTGATREGLEQKHGPSVGNQFPVHIDTVPGFEHLGKQEIAAARIEKKIPDQEGHKAFTVDFGPHVSIEKDLQRRDFTMNSMAIHTKTNELIDPFGGKKDIENKVIRHTNDSAFIEDPQRVLRMARFSAKLSDFKIHPETEKLASKINISSLDPEAHFKEMSKALDTEKPSRFFETLHRTGHLKQIHPELDKLNGIQHAPHPEDVWEHSMMAVDHAAKQGLPTEWRYAVLNHDLGKGSTPIGMPHYDHESRSKEHSNMVSDRLKVPNKFKDTSSWFAANHMRMHNVDKMSHGTLTKFAMDINNKGFDVNHVIGASKADQEGRGNPIPTGDFNRLRQAVKVVGAVKADDIVAKGYTGPQVGQLLHEKRVNALKGAGL